MPQSTLRKFITSALIIDDDENEILSLKEYLEEKDIWTKHYHPDFLDVNKNQFNNRKLIFLDLYLRDERSSTENIALIRKYFKTIIGNDFGTYGIILWTKHSEHLSEFLDKIYLNENPFTAPLFVIALEKNKYIEKQNYQGILEELESKLENDISSNFFIEWNKSVKQGSDNTISTLYGLFDTHKKKNSNLESVLYSLGCNYTGIPKENIIDYDIQKDLVKSLMDTLQFEISKSYNNIKNLFIDSRKLDFNDTKDVKIKVFSKLNSMLMMDFQNLSQKSPIPGNIYEIIDESSSLYINFFLDKKNNEINIETHDDFKDIVKRRVCIEVTPPCDFANNKKQLFSRIIGGIQLDYDVNILNKFFKTENFYDFLYPLQIENYEKPQMIIFDFYRFQTIKEDILKEEPKFEIIAKAKDKLFADILQKFSSHTARLGIAIMKP